MVITNKTPVGAVVAERLGRAGVFERLGIDYCCHGETPLGEACAGQALEVDWVLAEIRQSDREDSADGSVEIAFTAMTATELADHIEQTHHAYLRYELPRLAELIGKLLAHHGDRHPELMALQTTFRGLHEELASHMFKEERVLFPLIRELNTATRPFAMHCGSIANPIRVMEHEHDDAGDALARIRELTHDFRVPLDGCTSYRALYDGLAALEADLHHHIHKENNILFPKSAALEAALCSPSESKR
jgi:regulator of cell morphogenesis and NO signaling